MLARQKPGWEPGTRQAYHAITLGFYESELLRRVDPQHRSLGQFFQDEIATPLGLDIYIRLPETISNSRLATIARPSLVEVLRGFGLRFTLEAMNRRSKIVRALRGSEFPHDEQRIYARNLEVPSGGGVGTARAIAHVYSVFATGGSELGLLRETLDLLAAPATPRRNPSSLPPTSCCSVLHLLKAKSSFCIWSARTRTWGTATLRMISCHPRLKK